MRPTVVTVEALRCHECQVLMDPVEGVYVRRQLRTAVEVGYRFGSIERYELVNICMACDAVLTARELEADRNAARNVQSLCLLCVAGVVGALLCSIGWPSPIALLVTMGLLWYGILGRSFVGAFVTAKILETFIGEAATVAWMTPTTIVVIAVMLATKYGWNASPQRNLPAE